MALVRTTGDTVRTRVHPLILAVLRSQEEALVAHVDREALLERRISLISDERDTLRLIINRQANALATVSQRLSIVAQGVKSSYRRGYLNGLITGSAVGIGIGISIKI